jgi:hypothetical protein
MRPVARKIREVLSHDSGHHLHTRDYLSQANESAAPAQNDAPILHSAPLGGESEHEAAADLVMLPMIRPVTISFPADLPPEFVYPNPETPDNLSRYGRNLAPIQPSPYAYLLVDL